MRKDYKFIILCLVLCLIFTVGFDSVISPKSASTIKIINIKDIKSVKIDLGGKSNNPKEYSVLNLKDPIQVKNIKHVLSYLHYGKIKRYANETVAMKGGSPQYLIIQLKSGNFISISNAVKEKVTKLSNGLVERVRYNIPNEVTVLTDFNEKPFNISSIGLKKIISAYFNN